VAEDLYMALCLLQLLVLQAVVVGRVKRASFREDGRLALGLVNRLLLRLVEGWAEA
jgi:hypothetical protein